MEDQVGITDSKGSSTDDRWLTVTKIQQKEGFCSPQDQREHQTGCALLQKMLIYPLCTRRV